MRLGYNANRESETALNQITIDRTDEVDAQLEEAARIMGKTPAEIAALRLSLSTVEPTERANRIRQILAGSGLIRPSALTPQEIASYHEVKTIRVTGRPVSETL